MTYTIIFFSRIERDARRRERERETHSISGSSSHLTHSCRCTEPRYLSCLVHGMHLNISIVSIAALLWLRVAVLWLHQLGQETSPAQRSTNVVCRWNGVRAKLSFRRFLSLPTSCNCWALVDNLRASGKSRKKLADLLP